MTKTLLIADDNSLMRQIIKSTVTPRGWQVVGEATDGKQALDSYIRLKPDAVTMDLVMPDYDGLHGLTEIVRYDPAARVLVVSALDQTDVLKQAFRAGATDFLVKPFDKQCLIETLDRMVNSHVTTAETEL
jgi:two-component system, chemotaxis family, chemotaxis protein CheY